jgi:uncharacterized protein
MMIKPRYLILQLTNKCNLNCAYCYRKTDNTVKEMSFEVLEASIRLITSSARQCHVQLTGGEPTLVPYMIEHAAKTLRNIKPDATLGIQTNGTMLDSSLAWVFKKYNIQVGVSLDGPIAIQKQLRGNVPATLKGLRLLEAESIPFRVTTVLSNQNIKYLDKLVLMLGAFSNARGIGLDMLIQKGKAKRSGLVSPVDKSQMEDGLNRMIGALHLVNRRPSARLQMRELETVATAIKNRKRACFCHAGAGESLAVCPDGSFYPCSQTAGDSRFYMGNLDAPDTSQALSLKDYKLSNKDCASCPLYKKCPGDCYSRQYYNNEENQRLTCVMYQSLYKHLAGSYPHLTNINLKRLNVEHEGVI